MQIKQYLDSTYLKTPEECGLSKEENDLVVKGFVQDAIDERFKLIMIRPDKVKMVKELVTEQNGKLLIGTVISFPSGACSLDDKLSEAQQAIKDGADELDFVCNYEVFKNGDVALVKDEVFRGTELALQNSKTVKWIIEVAALSETEIIRFSALIKNVVISNFKEDYFQYVFVKSSTGFYTTEEGKPNGATLSSIIMMLENAYPLSVKAAGGVRTFAEAQEMIRLGVKRIGTSSAKAIAAGEMAVGNY